MDEATKKFYDSFLSDTEKEAVAHIAGNALVMVALKKVILSSVYYQGVLRTGIEPEPTRNAALAIAIAAGNGQTIRTDAELGQDVRALAEAVRLVENGFGRVEKFKEAPETARNKPNRAR